MGCAMPKYVFGHVRTVKAQISLLIGTVWSGPTLFANRITRYYRMYKWRAKAQIILCTCEGWSELCCFAWCGQIISLLSKQARKAVISLPSWRSWTRVWLVIRWLQVCWVWQHSLMERSWNIFYHHSLPSADSRRAVISFWWKQCAQVLVNRLDD